MKYGHRNSSLLALSALLAGAVPCIQGCAADSGADSSSIETIVVPSDERIDSTSQAASAIGWTQIKFEANSDWQVKNGDGSCARAQGNFLGTTSCNGTVPAQRWAVIQEDDGRYQMCRPEIAKVVAKVCIQLTPDAPCTFSVSEYYWGNCVYPTGWIGDKPMDYRIGKVVLSYVLKGKSAFTSAPGLFRRDGQFILDPARWMTRKSTGIVVPDKFAGGTNQQWSFLSLSPL